MFFWICNNPDRLQFFKDHGLGFLRVFRYVTFRATLAFVCSFLVCVLLGPATIRWLRLRKIGDLAGFDQKQMDEMMASKKGTPTMGGLLIVGAITVSTILLGNFENFYVTMALMCLLWMAAVGATDDWLKLTRRAGTRQGLRSKEKLLFQIGFGIVISYFTFHHGHYRPETHTLYFPFFKGLKFDMLLPSLEAWSHGHIPFHLGSLLFVLVATIVLTGTSNGVNLTDGLDGLAAGCVAIVSFTFFLVSLIVADQELATKLFLTNIVEASEMAVLAGAATGACLGFLWFNCHPASVFMGDTGSLALGTLIGYIAIVVRQELLLFMVGGIFVIEAISVLLQVIWYKFTRLVTGTPRRIFLMAPLHHHFQQKGWTETQVVVRFWLIAAILAAMALATLKLR